MWRVNNQSFRYSQTDFVVQISVKIVNWQRQSLSKILLIQVSLLFQVFGKSQIPLNSIKKICLISCFSPFTATLFVTFNNILQAKSSDFIIQYIK